jgi:tetratricopeptide (TPR) repeat protein
MHSTLKRGIVLTTLFTVVTPLLVLNWAKPGIGQEQQQSQQNNSFLVSNQQLKLISQARLVSDIAFQYTAAQRSASALKVLDQALAHTEKIEVDCYKATPLMQVANGYILAGEAAKGQKLLTRAFQIAREQTLALCTSGTTPQESLLSRAVEYAAAGYDNFVLSIIDGVDNWTRPMQMARIAGIYWQNKQPEKARQIIQRAIEIAQSQRLPEFITRRHQLMSIGFPLSEGGYPELLPPVIKQIQATPYSQDKASLENDLSMKVQDTWSLSKMLIATGEKAQAIALLNQVVPEIQRMPLQAVPTSPTARGLPPSSTLEIFDLTLFASQYFAAGQPEQAKTLLMNAQIAAESLQPSRERDQELTMVARTYAEIGQVKMAEDLARQLKSVDNPDPLLGVVDHRGEVLEAIVRQYVKTGNLYQAMTVVRSLSTTKKYDFSGIVYHLLQTKQYEQALQIARQEKIDRTPQMAMVWADAGQPEQALKIAQSLTAEDFSRQSMCKDCLISAIAQSFAKQGQLEQALQLAQRIQSSKDLTMIAAQYLKIDRVANQNKATEILDQALKLALSQ